MCTCADNEITYECILYIPITHLIEILRKRSESEVLSLLKSGNVQSPIFINLISS